MDGTRTALAARAGPIQAASGQDHVGADMACGGGAAIAATMSNTVSGVVSSRHVASIEVLLDRLINESS